MLLLRGIWVINYLNVILVHVVCDRQHVAGFARHCFAQLFTLVDVFEVLRVVRFLDIKEVILEIAESVWLKICKVSDVIFVWKFIAKAQGVQADDSGKFIFEFVARYVVFVKLVVWRTLSRSSHQLVLVIAYVVAASLPDICTCISVFTS